MEKYYLGQSIFPGSTSSSDQLNGDLVKSEIIEIQFNRQPPTFGILQLVRVGKIKKQSSESGKFNYELHLSVLELTGNKEAKFSSAKRVRLNDLTSRIVDYDTCKSVHLDGSSGASKQKPHCIVLCGDGVLISVSLTDESSEIISNACDDMKAFKFTNLDALIECRLTYIDASGDISEDADIESMTCRISVLSSKKYFNFDLSTRQGVRSLELIEKYECDRDDVTSTRFLRSIMVDASIVLLEMLDGNIRIVQKSNCLHAFESKSHSLEKGSDLDLSYLILRSSSSNEPTATIIVMNRTKITAYSLQIEDGPSYDRVFAEAEDPDNLLPNQPSFEFDECWSIDLNDIDAIRSLEAESTSSESDRDSARGLLGCLCPIWSMNQAKGSHWPKYMMVAFKYHLLIYSFEQEPVLPFSVVYDSAFLEVLPMSSFGEPNQALDALKQTNSASRSDREYVDTRLRPKLVQSHKLIGPQPGDLLFNTLFLSKKVRLTQLVHLPQIGLVVSRSTMSHTLGFKFTSSKLSVQNDNLYQQLVADSIRNSLNLQDEIARLGDQNSNLRDSIARLDLRSTITYPDQRNKSLDELLNVELRRRHHIGVLYDLVFSIPNLVDVREILVTSDVQTHFLNPIDSYQCIDRVHRTNDMATQGQALVLSKADIKIHAPALESTSIESNSLQTWISISLKDSTNQQVQINLPMFIIDGQIGHLSIYFSLSNFIAGNETSPKNIFGLDPPGSDVTQFTRFHKRSIEIKPLLSYEVTSEELTRRLESTCSFKIKGEFNEERAFSWLNEFLMMQNGDLKDTIVLRSAFTRCFIHITVFQASLHVTSNDLLGVELLKKHILSRATDNSVNLKVEDLSGFSVANLRHLIGCQYQNLVSIGDGIQGKADGGPNNNASSSDAGELLVDSLLQDVNFHDLPDAFLPEDMSKVRRSFLHDLDVLGYSLRTDKTRTEVHDEAPENLIEIYQGLIAGYLLDLLVDFDRMQGAKTTHEKVMIEARQKILRLISCRRLDAEGFIDEIINTWHKTCT